MFDVFICTYIEMPFTGREMALCMLEYTRSQSSKPAQNAFVREFSMQSKTAMHIWTLHKKFFDEGCFCTRKWSGRHITSEEKVECVRKKILQGPKKSLRRSGLKTQIPPTTIWRILRKRLIMKPFKLQLVQAIMAEDKRNHKPN